MAIILLMYKRTLILRGVNLGGSTKVPVIPNGDTRFKESLHDPINCSFVGRPFPLEEAEEHFSRLRKWGLTFLRFLVTWEAVEHAGPGVFDQDYLDYLGEVLKKANEYCMTVLVDPHQDVWSCFTGGDGAPAWTLEAIGMDPSRCPRCRNGHPPGGLARSPQCECQALIKTAAVTQAGVLEQIRITIQKGPSNAHLPTHARFFETTSPA